MTKHTYFVYYVAHESWKYVFQCPKILSCKNTSGYRRWSVLYLILVQQSLMHDVVKVCEKVCVWGNILPSLHDPADQLVGMELPLLVTLCQHGGLRGKTHTQKYTYI